MKRERVVQERFVTLNGLRFHDLEWGNAGAPVLLLLHGGWQTAADWSPVAEALAGRYRILTFDQRGHGRSDRAADDRLECFVEDLDAFVERFGLGRFSLLIWFRGTTRTAFSRLSARFFSRRSVVPASDGFRLSPYDQLRTKSRPSGSRWRSAASRLAWAPVMTGGDGLPGGMGARHRVLDAERSAA